MTKKIPEKKCILRAPETDISIVFSKVYLILLYCLSI